MNELALFAGGGGGILGGKLLGWNTVGAVEIEKYPRDILLARQKDGYINRFPIWDDITTFDGRPWKGAVDIVSGGFPCQDISAAGKGAGIDGKRSGLWGEMSRVVREVSPRFVFVENSPMLTSRGLHRVLGDLAESGYNARWIVLGADDAGAWHRRKRIWILGYSSLYGQSSSEIGKGSEERGDYSTTRKIETGKFKGSGPARNNEEMGYHDSVRRDEKQVKTDIRKSQLQVETRGRSISEFREWWVSEPKLDRVVNEMADRVDRIKAIGNGQVSAVAALAFIILSEGLI